MGKKNVFLKNPKCRQNIFAGQRLLIKIVVFCPQFVYHIKKKKLITYILTLIQTYPNIFTLFKINVSYYKKFGGLFWQNSYMFLSLTVTTKLNLQTTNEPDVVLFIYLLYTS